MRVATLRSTTVVLGIVLCLPPVARADYDETELRLKAVGVDAPLRKKVHEAIERGVEYLVSKQQPDGHWNDDFYGGHHWGVTALCALALRHAGGPKANSGARRAIDWLVRNDQLAADGGLRLPKSLTRLGTVVSGVYESGIFLMLLAADSRPPNEGRRAARDLAAGIDPASGWWGYLTTLTPEDRAVPGSINLSTTQFAALGLWAASRMGIPVDSSVWSRHAEGLLASQQSGSWRYTSAGIKHPNDSPYPTGTFMGCANLALVRSALRGRGSDASLDRRLAAAHEAALDALRRDGRVFLSTAGKRPPKWELIRPVGFSYYALYALEKACIFFDLEKLGETPWYVSGAKTLLAFQGKDGSWAYEDGDDPFVSTAFALLFLVRSSQTYHPVTPRAPDAAPATPMTPGGGPTK